MMNQTIAFATTNFIARELGYGRLPGWRLDDPAHPYLGGWAECAAAVHAWFAPEDTYRLRLQALLEHVRAAGFDAVELWSGHLSPDWATDAQVATARSLLRESRIAVVGFHAYLGATRDSAARTCEIATALGTDLVTGGGGAVWQTDRSTALAVLADHGARLAIENHPEHVTPRDLLAEIGPDAHGLAGVNLDTGWWATHGYDPVDAIDELADHVLHVQLKDVTEPGGHEPSRLGGGCVPITACLRTLKRHGYRGAYSLEYLSAATDPIDICRIDRNRILHTITESIHNS